MTTTTKTGGQVMKLETINKERATEMLTHNHGNRPADQRTVYVYAEIMARGDWRLNDQAITFDTNGRLINGQHRLYAIVASNATIQSYVLYNADPQLQSVTDKNRVRTVPEDLGMAGIQHGREIFGWINTGRRLIMNAHSKVTTEDAKRYVEQYEAAVKFGVSMLGRNAATRRIPVSGALLFAFPASPATIAELAEEIATGDGLHQGDPAYNARRYLLETASGKREESRVVALKILRCAIQKIEGETLHHGRLYANDSSVAYFEKYHAKDSVLRRRY